MMASKSSTNVGKPDPDDVRSWVSGVPPGLRSFIDSIQNVLMGTLGNEKLSTSSGSTVVFGLAGDDTLRSSHDNTALVGGRGNDTLITEFTVKAPPGGTAHATAFQVGGDGNDTLKEIVRVQGLLGDNGLTYQDLYADAYADSGSGNDDISVTASIDPGDLPGTTANVTLKTHVYGGDGNDTIYALADGHHAIGGINQVENYIDGGSGNDRITVHAQTDGNAFRGTAINTVYGGDGNDVIEATIIGDSLANTLAKNALHGGRGNDMIYAYSSVNSDDQYGTGINELWGDEGNDTLVAVQIARRGVSSTSNYLDGGTGNDNLKAEITAWGYRITAENHLEGGSGADTLTASIVATAFGGPGSGDLYHVSNILNGGDGNDSLSAYLSVDASEMRAPDGSTYENRLDGGTGNDTLVATVAPGSLGSNFLFGGDGNDRLTVIGGTGNVLDGGNGNDTLVGSSGDDLFTGGRGSDTFVFGPSTGHDIITDFEHGKDKVDMKAFTAAAVHSLKDLTIASLNGDCVIRFDASNDITVKGVSSLYANDFLFA
ncbi:calcium-binding protein [Microvirga puerhi]|uniref:M10 family metallopeptidase C-terminal domain-containing protein n=1 Tax=Microvirga puerhi TaxID=2876078 RepID=A0ABS7VRR8_9HYPH|nr:calcium-binding protein [Microvirga puerhi]MBZ6078258.1 M10 family metallopeptidase C-terminal domain-containing protein [Microvirga puerhi]